MHSIHYPHRPNAIGIVAGDANAVAFIVVRDRRGVVHLDDGVPSRVDVGQLRARVGDGLVDPDDVAIGQVVVVV